MSKPKYEKVKLEGEDYRAFINGKGDPIIVPMGADFNTYVSCPPIPEAVCPFGFDPECQSGEVWCMHNGEGD